MAHIYKLPSGKWHVQVRKKGFSRRATFDKKSQAKDWATQIESQINQVAVSGYTKPKGLTIGKIIKLYTESVPQKGRTQQASLSRMETAFSKVPLDAVPVALQSFITKRVAGGTGGVTIAQDLSYLATVLDWAREVRRIDVNPDAARQARRGLKHRGLKTRSKERTRVPTEDEMQTLFAHWDKNPRQTIPMTVICRFALASGMRLGEITSIKIEDVDSNRKTVIIRDRKDPKEKIGNDQTVPLLPDAWSIVEPRIEDKKAGRLFGFNSRSVSTAFTRAVAATGINDLHFHDLRHAATTNFFRMGLDIPKVALLTGHKSWENLKRYTNLQPEDVHNAIQ